MKIVDFNNEDKGISDLRYELNKEKITIRWMWPQDIDIVYVLKTNDIDEFSLHNINKNDLKLYTKEEYKEFNGYCETIREVNQYKYWIFPAIEEHDDILMFTQSNGNNEIVISTGKPKITYEIKEIRSIKSFFSKQKALQIIIYSEAALKKDVLTYVKKYGSYPVNKEDGICFDFINNIHAGKSTMPEITVDKNEYIKIFIKDTEKYGDVYELMRK